MSEQATLEVPDTLDKLNDQIRQSNAEEARSENVEALRKLARELTQDEPLHDSDESHGYRKAHYELVDGREAEIDAYAEGVPDYLTDTIISLVEKIKDKNGHVHAFRKRYFINGDSITSTANVALGVGDRDESDNHLYDDDIEPVGTLDAEDDEGDKLESLISRVSNKEVIDLIRLLSTSEQFTPEHELEASKT